MISATVVALVSAITLHYRITEVDIRNQVSGVTGVVLPALSPPALSPPALSPPALYHPRYHHPRYTTSVITTSVITTSVITTSVITTSVVTTSVVTTRVVTIRVTDCALIHEVFHCRQSNLNNLRSNRIVKCVDRLRDKSGLL